MSELLGVTYVVTKEETGALKDVDLLRSVSDSFVFDVRSITSATRREIGELYGSEGVLQLMLAMALYDGVLRMEATKL